MFTTFFLRRKPVSALNKIFGTSQIYHPDVAKITRIQPELLKVVPCAKPTVVNRSDHGIPVDIDAMMLMLSGPKDQCILPYLVDKLKDKFAKKEPLTFFCGGSTINGNVPFVTIPTQAGEPILIGQVPPTCKECTNGYQLFYAA